MALPGETCQHIAKAYIFRYNGAKQKWDAMGERCLCKLQLFRRRTENHTTYRLLGRTEGPVSSIEPILQLEIGDRTKVTGIDETFIQVADGNTADLLYGLKFSEPVSAELFKVKIEQALAPDVPVEDDLPPPQLPVKSRSPQPRVPPFASVRPARSPNMPRPQPRHGFQSAASGGGAAAAAAAGGVAAGGVAAAAAATAAAGSRTSFQRAPVQSRSSIDDSVIESLKDAIAEGAVDRAKTLASRLAERRVNVKIEVLEGKPEPAKNKCKLKVMVEDRETSGGSFSIEIALSSTVKILKKMVYERYNFPRQVQRWFYKQRLFKDDDERLDQLGVEPDSIINLYLLSAKSVDLTRQQVEEEDQRQLRHQPQSFSRHNRLQQQESVQTVRDGLQQRAPVAASPPVARPRLQPVPVGQNPLAGQLASEALQQKRILLPDDDVNVNLAAAAAVPAPVEEASVGWPCPDCTFINKPTRPGCEVCGSCRPADYEVPQGYVLTDDEKYRIEEEERQQTLLVQAQNEAKEREVKEREENLKRLMNAADLDLVPNDEAFECPICFCDVEPGEGVRLRECLHQFCKECLGEHVRNCQDPDIRCPFVDDNYQCDEPLTEREIRRLVSEEELKRLHSRGIDLALGEMGNSFYCRTPDCPGRCVYDDDVNDFDCPVCKKRNCLLCKAIHHPEMNCKEYQEDLKRKAANDEAAKATQDMLDKMVETGDAMLCPKCKVIVQKKDGCDWIRCSMCKTEICWATKGPRWGPKGKGDTSGGCRCGVGKQRCHPKCRNCH